MARHRFHVDDVSTDRVAITGEEADHARRVLRLAPGDTVELLDGRGGVASGEVTEAGRSFTIAIGERWRVPRLKPRVDLAAAIPKGDRAATLIEKASELSADRVIPLITERSVVEPGKGKRKRFERIAAESAKQCGRAWTMAVDAPVKLSRLLTAADYDVKRIADLPRATGSMQELQAEAARSDTVARPYHSQAESVLVLIGPEGGWTEAERAQAREAGFATWRLGPAVMRIETAALAALAILRYPAQPMHTQAP